MTLIQYHPIGLIHSPFTNIEGMPIQPSSALGIQGWVEVKPEFQPTLEDFPHPDLRCAPVFPSPQGRGDYSFLL